MASQLLNSAMTHSLLLVLPIAAALLLRLARCRGWAVLGGVIAGILLGPDLLGRVAPDLYEQHFVGAVAEREARDAVARRHAAEQLAADAAGLGAKVRLEMDERQSGERRAAEAAWAAETWHFQRPFRSYTSAIIVIALLGAGLLRESRPPGLGPDPITPASIGLWAAAVPGGLAAAAALWWWGASPPAAVLAGAAVAIGPWAPTAADRAAANGAEHGGAALVDRAGRVASLAAIVAVATAFALERGWIGLLHAAPLAALPVGWMLPRFRNPVRARAALEMTVVPVLAACAALRVEPLTAFALGPVVVLVLLSGDGRWLGAFLGALVSGGRGARPSMRLVLGAMAAGPTQLAVLALAVHTRSIAPPIAFALLVGAVVVEVTAPARRWVAEMDARIEP